MAYPLKAWNGSQWVQISTADTNLSAYQTTTQADAKYVNKTVGGLNLVVPTSVAVGSGSGTVSTNGAVTFTGASSVSLNGCFNSTYDNYRIVYNGIASAAATIQMRMRGAGTDNATAGSYLYNAFYMEATAGYGVALNSGGNTLIQLCNTGVTQLTSINMDISQPFLATPTSGMQLASVLRVGLQYFGQWGTFAHQNTTSYDGFSLFPASGNLTGTIRIYGYNNGA
jgi:hypothetical protein